MSYKIAYAMPAKLEKKQVNIHHRRSKTMLILVIVAIAVSLIIPGKQKNLIRFFIPGETKITAEAFTKMIETMRDGTSAQEAAVAFCQQILDDSFHEAS